MKGESRMISGKRLLALLSVCALAAASTACSGLGVQPWDRDVLARDDMQLVSDPIEAGLDEHIYFSKEASSGGQGFGGGGCGCN
jgi:hypothetical protein